MLLRFFLYEGEEELGRCAGPCFAVHGIAVHEALQGVSTDPGMFEGCGTNRSWRSPLEPVRPEVSERIGVSGRR